MKKAEIINNSREGERLLTLILEFKITNFVISKNRIFRFFMFFLSLKFIINVHGQILPTPRNENLNL